MLVAARPPAVVNCPPAYTLLPDTASANTKREEPTPPNPESSADQLLPSHLAIRLAALPPAVVNTPPAYTSLPDTASANTTARTSRPDTEYISVVPAPSQ